MGGVADGAEDAAPVGVFAVQGGLDERGARDAGGDGVGVRGGWGGADVDLDELGGAFAVADDEVGELLAEVGEDAGEGYVVGVEGVVGGWGWRGGGVVVGGVVCGRRRAGGAVGEDGEGVVGGGVAVDGDAVE